MGSRLKVDSKMCETMKLDPQDQRDFDFGKVIFSGQWVTRGFLQAGGDSRNEEIKAQST